MSSSRNSKEIPITEHYQTEDDVPMMLPQLLSLHKSPTSSAWHQKSTLMTSLIKTLSLIASQIRMRNVCNNCSHKSN
ncbi:unnamed protein product [Hymenolepis diminuta]|uniref:Uncharacterized protein n=1 Tax=Hymenolepis diminuta TaxID=6216 RepID=A0A564YSA0_HYMDI|nr:unnamed protein product [Hymenolepis diminuta]VUZ56573.1 unnamed protein product [Hymenolepis diminuta]VUZ56574.1 unnamed protein product [Hymenolepis diminuta]